MSTNTGAATAVMCLLILLVPGMGSMQQGYVNHGLAVSTVSIGNQLQAKMPQSKSNVPSSACVMRHTGLLHMPIDAFGVTVAQSQPYWAMCATAAATTVIDPDGKIVGADPDGRIRFELRRDYGRGF
jgi:hypothetical protein